MKFFWLSVLFVMLVAARTLDYDAYCAGWCRGRYQDGIFKQGKGCGCIDWYPLDMNNPIRMKIGNAGRVESPGSEPQSPESESR